MNKVYNLEVKTVQRGNYADEYEGRGGLMKLPYKMLLQQSEIRNGQLQSEIDELKDLIASLKETIAEQEDEIKQLQKGLLKDYHKEVKHEEMYRDQRKCIERLHRKIRVLRQDNSELLSRLMNQKGSKLTLRFDYFNDEQL